MTPPALNVLAAKPVAHHRRLPWPVIAATILFMLMLGNDMSESRQKLVSLRYAQSMSYQTDGTTSALPAAPGVDAISNELTYPWDHVLNQLQIGNDRIELLSYDATNDESANHLRVKAVQLSEFWSWLDGLKKRPQVQSVSAVSVTSQENNHVFDVAIHWSRP